jgi:membrane protease YdiL (CAAX protease family)
LNRRSVIALAVLPSVALGLLNDLYLEPLSRYGAACFWAADFGQYVVVPTAVAFVLAGAGGIKPRDYGFRSVRSGTSIAEAIGLCLFMCAMYWLAYEPVKQISYRFLWRYAGTFGYASMQPEAPFLRHGVTWYLSVTAAFVEEAVFRGLPWLYFAEWNLPRYRTTLYVASTSLLFAATHSEQGAPGMLAALSLGIVTAMLYVKIRNLWPFVAAHFVIDVFSFW